MRKIFFCFLLSGISNSVDGQTPDQKSRYISEGMLRAQATISMGFMSLDPGSIYLHGNLEYYIDNNISLRGDGYYSLSANVFEFNHSLLAGASYHIKTKTHFDPYIGFGPGVAINKGLDYSNTFCDPGPCPESGIRSVNPLISPILGFNYYFERLFHIFLETRYIHGKYLSGVTVPWSLSELRFSFGLGFNLDLLKKKKG